MPVGINNNHPGPLFKTLQSVKSYAKSEDGELKLIHMASSLGLTRYFFYQFCYKTKTRLNNLKFKFIISKRYLFIRIDIILYIYLKLTYINIKDRKLTIISFHFEHNRFCRLLSDFYCSASCDETTDDKNGFLSSSWAFHSHGGETTSTHIPSLPSENGSTGWLLKSKFLG